MLNNTSIMGRLTRDPELRHTKNEIPIAFFTLAVDRTYRKDAEKQTDFIDVVAWSKAAEFVIEWFKKGLLVAVEGPIRTRTYVDRNGITRKQTEINAYRVHFTGDKRGLEADATVEADDLYDQEAAGLFKLGSSENATETETGQSQPDGVRRCRECGCTEDNACPGGCYWVEPDLCSVCAANPRRD
jgi:single-strand DNA-binding protein